MENPEFLFGGAQGGGIGHGALTPISPTAPSWGARSRSDTFQIEVMDNPGQVPAVGAAAFCTFPRAAGAAGFPVRCFANREREFSSGGIPGPGLYPGEYWVEKTERPENTGPFLADIGECFSGRLPSEAPSLFALHRMDAGDPAENHGVREGVAARRCRRGCRLSPRPRIKPR